MATNMLSNNQINYIVNFALAKRMKLYITSLDYTLSLSTEWHCQKLVDVLVDQNTKSVNYRYNESEEYKYKFETIGTPYDYVNSDKAFSVIKLISNYEYQCSSSPDWYNSDAHLILECIKEEAIQSLPGYHESEDIH